MKIPKQLIPLAVACSAALLEPIAAAQAAPRTLASREVLTEDTTWQYPTLALGDGAVIVTNGFELRIIVDTLRVGSGVGAARMVTFDSGANSEPPAAGPDGKPGKSYDPGPNTEGPGPATDGNAGGRGDDGTHGANGNAGRNAGKIIITVSESFEGNLVIRNAGEAGQPGAKGGKGGDGGTGQQGGRARPKRVEVSGQEAYLPDLGAGTGGKGGDGGNGGNGGMGGNGGNGGDVTVRILGKLSGAVQVDARGGSRGASQKGSSGGYRGGGGRGGRGAQASVGRDGEIAPSGADGKPGADAAEAKDGTSGVVLNSAPPSR